MALSQTDIDWAMTFTNDPEVYRDGVESIADIRYEPKSIIIIAIDEGNPPVIPLKQIAFKLDYADEEYQEPLGYALKLLNADEVDSGQSRPKQFSAHLPIDVYDDLLDPDDWIADDEDCEGDCEC